MEFNRSVGDGFEISVSKKFFEKLSSQQLPHGCQACHWQFLFVKRHRRLVQVAWSLHCRATYCMLSPPGDTPVEEAGNPILQ